jgi:hypothetical protein
VKRTLAFILLTCLFFTVLGYHFVFHLQLAKAKTEMKKAIHNGKREKDAILFAFSKEAAGKLEWENEEEFYYEGRMYDVIEQHSTNGTRFIRCIPDNLETTVLAQYLHTSSQDHSGDKPLTSLIRLATAPFIEPQLNLPKLSEKELNTCFGKDTSPLSSVCFPIHTPPPKSC